MQLSEKTKNILSVFLRFGLSAILLSYLYFKIDIDKTVQVVKQADIKFILYALAIFLIIHVFILIRWRILIMALGLKVSVFTMVRYFFIGLFGNLFLPSAIGGDVIKTIGLCSSSDQKPAVVASVLLDRLSGFAGMIVVAFISFILGYHLIRDVSLLISILVLAGGSLTIATILFNEKLYSFCCRIFGAFPRVKKALMNMHYDIVLLKDDRSAIYKAVGISCICQIFLGIAFYLIGKALHQEIMFISFFIFVPLICVVSCLPSIGGLGVREAGAAYLFAKVGVASGISVSISLINFLFMVIVGVGGWLFFMTTKSTPTLETNVESDISVA